MKKRSIYTGQSHEISCLFEEAGTNEKVLCIPIDYAKKDHTVMFCNGDGDILRKPFSIRNNPEGLAHLVDQVKRSCRRRGIKQKHVFFGGEDVGSYAENFIHTLRSQGWLVAGVNAQEAKKQRENLQASTDRIDLMGIAAMLLKRKANFSPAQKGIYRNLRQVVRHRRTMVVMSTQVKNRIHTVVDCLFPGFLDDSKSGIQPFSKGSLWLMEDRFGSAHIGRRKRESLIRDLKRHGVGKADGAAAKLQELAAKVLKPSKEYVHTLQFSLGQHVKLFRGLQENIQQMEKEIALWLAQTQGAFLTSCKGIGLILAAGVTAEIGDPYRQKPLNNLTSFAGIVPRVKQTGGPEGKTSTGHVSKRCNRILKDYIVQSASHIGRYGPEALKNDHKRRQASGQHADFGMARRYLRMCMSLMRRSQVYLPPELRKTDASVDEHAAYYLSLWPAVRDKWIAYGALETAFSLGRPLGEWRLLVQEVYGIQLKL